MYRINKVLLRNGTKIPCVGMGTGIIKKRAKNALHLGILFFAEKIKCLFDKDFRKNNKYPILRDTRRDKLIPTVLEYFLNNYTPCFFDTARAYAYSEEVLGDILKRNRFKREELFVVSKIRNKDQLIGAEEEGVRLSLKYLGLDSLDLLLLHWPQTETFIQSYKRMVRLQNIGLTKGIGVANFTIDNIEELINNNLPLPLVNEVECHPYYQQKELIEYCNNKNIKIIAYTPTGRKLDAFSSLPEIIVMCEKYKASPIEIIMSWHFSRGVIPIFSTTKKEHADENLRFFANDPFSLTEEELSFIASLDSDEKYFPDPKNCDFSRL